MLTSRCGIHAPPWLIGWRDGGGAKWEYSGRAADKAEERVSVSVNKAGIEAVRVCRPLNKIV